MIDQLPIRADLLLLLIAAALYITDLSRLLYINELIFFGKQPGQFAFRFSGSQFELARRYPFILKPLDPAIAVIRLIWTKPPSEYETTPQDSEQVLRQLRWAGIQCRLLLPQIFIGLPLLYVFGHNDLLILALLAAIYAQVVAMLVWMLRHRRGLGLDGPGCALLCFESLICIPYAINLHRKLSERLLPGVLPDDVLGIAATVLSEPDQERFRRQINEHALALLEHEAEDSVRRRRLVALLARL